MDESSRGEHIEEIGLVGVHRDLLLGLRVGGKPAPTFRDHAPCYAGAQRRGDKRRGGVGCVTGPAIYAKASMMQKPDDASLDDQEP